MRPWNDYIHVVLVEPGDNLNIGSVARAMKNLGFSNLHLVAPANFDIDRAKVTACWAEEVLITARKHTKLSDAIAPMADVVGFSTRAGKNKPSPLSLETWARSAANFKGSQTALLFGPEDTGLRSEHMEQCRALIQIPANTECPSYNLAQAVLLALYELSRGSWDKENPVPRDLPCWNDYYQVDRMVEEIAQKSGFYNEGTPEQLPGLIRTVTRRANLDGREMKVVLGWLSRVLVTIGGR
ncbi:MAG: hypothetical protein DCC75_06915 [Proteobacteria bacterium]|nr:MAG: hypothetical protein DCC75_06915 [Pseudomonadota bacterium]